MSRLAVHQFYEIYEINYHKCIFTVIAVLIFVLGSSVVLNNFKIWWCFQKLQTGVDEKCDLFLSVIVLTIGIAEKDRPGAFSLFTFFFWLSKTVVLIFILEEINWYVELNKDVISMELFV